MAHVNIAEAKARLSELIDDAITGEPQIIMRRGKPVAQITRLPIQKKPVSLEMLQALTGSMRLTPSVMDMLRDEERY